MEDKLREELYEKLSLEYDSFIEEIKKLPPEKIIDKSYEKVGSGVDIKMRETWSVSHKIW